MDKKQSAPELMQAELLPTEEEQVPQVSAAPPARKRKGQLDSDDDDDDDDAEPRAKRPTRPTSKPARLTRQNLARFSRKMGNNGSLLGSLLGSTAHRGSTTKSSKSSNTKTLPTMASGFAIQAYKNGVLNPSSSKPPANLSDICQRSALPRGMASPTASEYGGYVDRVNKAVLYKDNPHAVTLPHIAGEWKGPDGSMAEATLQSSYDGAAEMASILSLLQKCRPCLHQALSVLHPSHHTTATAAGAGKIKFKLQ
jgi:hypothetical protein